jgi:hypothetical protein
VLIIAKTIEARAGEAQVGKATNGTIHLRIKELTD